MSYLAHNSYGGLLELLAALRKNGQPFCRTFRVGTTHGGRPIHGLRIHAGRSRATRAVLVVGGAHAREMIPPEAVIRFASSLCQAYANGTGFAFGGKSYPAAIAELLVEAIELNLVPLLNVDGRQWVETNDQSWRKNRRPGASCVGVDLNRNYDFLFSSGIGTSSNPCHYEIYRGPSAHSEPEVQAVRDLISGRGNIRGVLDVHSYAGLILYPWGDDQNQSTDPNMNFRNPSFDGQRGIKNDRYQEHIVLKDWRWYERTAARMRDRVKEVANRNYVAQQGVDLYPTSGTLKDYPYSRHLADNTDRKIMSMTVEIGFSGDGAFRPQGTVAQTIRNEGAVLIVEFCLAIMCVGDAVLSAGFAPSRMATELRSLREELGGSPAGRQYLEWLDTLGGEAILRLLDPAVARELPQALKDFRAWRERGDAALDRKAAERATRLLRTVGKSGSKEFRTAIRAVIADIERMKGQPACALKSTIKASA